MVCELPCREESKEKVLPAIGEKLNDGEFNLLHALRIHAEEHLAVSLLDDLILRDRVFPRLPPLDPARRSRSTQQRGRSVSSVALCGADATTCFAFMYCVALSRLSFDAPVLSPEKTPLGMWSLSEQKERMSERRNKL